VEVVSVRISTLILIDRRMRIFKLFFKLLIYLLWLVVIIGLVAVAVIGLGVAVGVHPPGVRIKSIIMLCVEVYGSDSFYYSGIILECLKEGAPFF
jgi:hypothetical protein